MSGPDPGPAAAAPAAAGPDLPGAEPLPPCAALLRDVVAGERALSTGSGGPRRTWPVVGPLPGAVGSLAPHE